MITKNFSVIQKRPKLGNAYLLLTDVIFLEYTWNSGSSLIYVCWFQNTIWSVLSGSPHSRVRRMSVNRERIRTQKKIRWTLSVLFVLTLTQGFRHFIGCNESDIRTVVKMLCIRLTGSSMMNLKTKSDKEKISIKGIFVSHILLACCHMCDISWHSCQMYKCRSRLNLFTVLFEVMNGIPLHQSLKSQ